MYYFHNYLIEKTNINTAMHRDSEGRIEWKLDTWICYWWWY